MVLLQHLIYFGLCGLSSATAGVPSRNELVLEARAVTGLTSDAGQFLHTVKLARGLAEGQAAASTVHVPAAELHQIIGKLKALEVQVNAMLPGIAKHATESSSAFNSGSGNSGDNCHVERLLLHMTRSVMDGSIKVRDHPLFARTNCDVEAIAQSQKTNTNTAVSSTKNTHAGHSGAMTSNENSPGTNPNKDFVKKKPSTTTKTMTRTRTRTVTITKERTKATPISAPKNDKQTPAVAVKPFDNDRADSGGEAPTKKVQGTQIFVKSTKPTLSKVRIPLSAETTKPSWTETQPKYHPDKEDLSGEHGTSQDERTKAVGEPQNVEVGTQPGRTVQFPPVNEVPHPFRSSSSFTRLSRPTMTPGSLSQSDNEVVSETSIAPVEPLTKITANTTILSPRRTGFLKLPKTRSAGPMPSKG